MIKSRCPRDQAILLCFWRRNHRIRMLRSCDRVINRSRKLERLLALSGTQERLVERDATKLESLAPSGPNSCTKCSWSRRVTPLRNIGMAWMFTAKFFLLESVVTQWDAWQELGRDCFLKSEASFFTVYVADVRTSEACFAVNNCSCWQPCRQSANPVKIESTKVLLILSGSLGREPWVLMTLDVNAAFSQDRSPRHGTCFMALAPSWWSRSPTCCIWTPLVNLERYLLVERCFQDVVGQNEGVSVVSGFRTQRMCFGLFHFVAPPRRISCSFDLSSRGRHAGFEGAKSFELQMDLGEIVGVGRASCALWSRV